MIPDIYSIIVVVGITGLGVLLHELLIKNHVSTKGNRLFFYFFLVLHVLAFQGFYFPNELNFVGDLTTLNLEKFIGSTSVDGNIENRFETIVVLIYFLGVVFGLIKMMFGIVKVVKLIRKSSTGKHKFERLVKASNFQPCTFFKYILIPADLPKTLYNSVYRHESYHARQMHTIDMILWRFLSILFWFNPFVHLLRSRQSQNLEYDTDKYIVKSIPKDQYCEHLLSLTFNSRKMDFYPMFNKSNSYLRIKRLNKDRERKKRWSDLTLLFAFTLLFGSTIMSKASLLPKTRSNVVNQMSKPEFTQNDLGYYIDSVLQARIGDKFDNIDKSYDLHLFLDITIDEEGKVIKVNEDSRKSRQGGDSRTNDFLSGLLIETIQNMPSWKPAKENGIRVKSTIQEEFHFAGEGE
ncbi:M56 family metallopeptidase [Ulvibacterium marinum]|uniref:M56 family metallopeptidase n=1 Tax=Ulvibacterium marinum TaxID=2419782 RepID=A0A3B0BSW1_9FLAO|nr:M56 family metallopeptidase [Ulvibacterium marinum]RKN75097.1 M56 family metallopeptidase [Ulvibacterium marinum]